MLTGFLITSFFLFERIGLFNIVSICPSGTRIFSGSIGINYHRQCWKTPLLGKPVNIIMLSPLSSITSLPSASLLPKDQSHFLQPEFFNPIATEVGLSCTYSEEFYSAFSEQSSASINRSLAMMVLEYMPNADKARLPLFAGASSAYLKQVLAAIRGILVSADTSPEILVAKSHIMNCASQLGYLGNFGTIAHTKELGNITYYDVFPIGVKLNGVCLAGMNLRNATMWEMDFSGADLSGADLTEAILVRSNLTGANLTGAILTKAQLSGANLTGATLTGADLSRASLLGTNLSDAQMSLVTLNRAFMYGSILKGASIEKDALKLARFD